jgi:hypothetical protein
MTTTTIQMVQEEVKVEEIDNDFKLKKLQKIFGFEISFKQKIQTLFISNSKLKFIRKRNEKQRTPSQSTVETATASSVSSIVSVVYGFLEELCCLI